MYDTIIIGVLRIHTETRGDVSKHPEKGTVFCGFDNDGEWTKF